MRGVLGRATGRTVDATVERSAPPVLFTTDEAVVEEIRRLAAVAGCEVTLVHEPARGRTPWAEAPLVLVAADAVSRVGQAALPRRDGVVLLGDVDDPGRWRSAVQLGAREVRTLPADEAWVVDRLADCAEAAGAAGTVVATLGGRGGAGASTLAVALAAAARRSGRSAVLLDLDPLGGGLDLAIGAETVPGMRWGELARIEGRMSAVTLRDALPQRDGIAVLTFDRGPAADDAPQPAPGPGPTLAVLGAACRAWDLVVADLPRWLGPGPQAVLARARSTIVVVPAEVRATAGAASVVARVALFAADLRIVVRGPAPGGLTAEAIAQVIGAPLAAYARGDRAVGLAADRGVPGGRNPRSPLRQLTDRLVEQLFDDRSRA